ncbi:PP2C family serine/threonine-protein phosphatase [Pseudonocardia sp. KRD291]|uniref:PP2C family protein-serine/threonine phosphatase n=1 Tax=Pseudonocardia sp. KRD291 TaxID=2792007 RepID=UPI001C49E67A|nr:PP2C family serine/threonine-protein phosphatase [Pseudonocardia sp. KRD291]MBW0105845.1 serine/threonine-protein phosphatase [Pseudonocardia sp. KRD291]
MVLGLRSAIGSDVGRRRTSNQDSGATTGRLLVVADGMGGHAHGEVASAVTVSALTELDARLPPDLSDVDLAEELSNALVAATDNLEQQALADPDMRGMGTTVVSLLLTGEHLALAHIGDSRIYRLRAGSLEQLTHDHTMVQQLVDEGQITPEEALVHPRRSVLMRALSTDHEPEPDLDRVPIEAGDRFLLCSDGVTAVLGDDALQETLGSEDDPGAAVARLIELANEGGGPDNITAIVADVVEVADADEPQAQHLRVAGAVAEGASSS